jgi:hypothetical protein
MKGVGDGNMKKGEATASVNAGRMGRKTTREKKDDRYRN